MWWAQYQSYNVFKLLILIVLFNNIFYYTNGYTNNLSKLMFGYLVEFKCKDSIKTLLSIVKEAFLRLSLPRILIISVKKLI